MADFREAMDVIGIPVDARKLESTYLYSKNEVEAACKKAKLDTETTQKVLDSLKIK